MVVCPGPACLLTAINPSDNGPASLPLDRRAEAEGRLRGFTQAEGIVMIVFPVGGVVG